MKINAEWVSVVISDHVSLPMIASPYHHWQLSPLVQTNRLGHIRTTTPIPGITITYACLALPKTCVRRIVAVGPCRVGVSFATRWIPTVAIIGSSTRIVPAATLPSSFPLPTIWKRPFSGTIRITKTNGTSGLYIPISTRS